MSEDTGAMVNFSGIVRLFPLPNLVVFPQVLQPLHIFEPRYRQMTRDALAGDRLIAMALLQPGPGMAPTTGPSLFPVVCITRIVAEQAFPDGRYNLLIRGLKRAHILEEVPTDKLYRLARVQLMEDEPLTDTKEEALYRREFLRLAPNWLTGPNAMREQLETLLKSDTPLGVLCDILTFALPMDLQAKQNLLSAVSVEHRARVLLYFLNGKKERTFPPEFSVN
jgi:Lon protease-like protein